MLDLQPMRAFSFRTSEIQQRFAELFANSPKEDDRSQFVRFGRISAELRSLRSAGDLVVSDEPRIVQLGDLELGWIDLRTTELEFLSTIRPSAGQEKQRALEATQFCFHPILIHETESENWVVGNADQAWAALELQALMARPGRTRLSDFALAARVPAPTFRANPVHFAISNPENVVQRLKDRGFTFGSGGLTITINQVVYGIEIEGLEDLAELLVQTLGIRHPDAISENAGSKTATVKLPEISLKQLQSMRPTAFDCFICEQVPPFGVIMGNLAER